MPKPSDVLDNINKRITDLHLRAPEDVQTLFAELRALFEQELATTTSDSLEALRVRWRGRKGFDRLIRDNWLTPESKFKRAVGQAYNDFKTHIETALGERRARLQAEEAQRRAQGERLDLTVPGNAARRGARHLITQTMEEITDIFIRLGYSVVEGPEMETAYYNFEALNMPAHHPARDMWDTLYIDAPKDSGSLLLRTHTSPVQIRVMEKQPPPVRIIVPGKVYRHDNPDASHSFMFHQLEGLAVDRDITFADLKGTLDHFLREFLGPQTQTRLVPSYFPFTEPSADVHGTCIVCAGKGCRVCKFTGWLELVGCGMVHPAVYGFVGYNPDQISGFAFGMGVDRLALLKYGVDDLQVFFQNDVRFLQQFRR